MGSIPLPALALKPVQQPEPMDAIGRMMQLKSMMQGQQAQQQNLQSGALDIQQKQQALKDQQAMTAAMQEWDGKDVQSLIPIVVKNGASANAVMGLKAKVLEQQEKYSTIAKNDAETGAKNLETMKQKNDMILGALNTVAQAPDEQFGQALTSTVQDLLQKGLIDPQHGQAAMQLAQVDPAKGKQALTMFEKSLMSQSQQMDQAAKDATLAKTQAETQKLKQEMGTGKAAYEQTLADLQQGKDVTSDRIAAAKAYEASESKVSSSSDAYGVKSTNVSRPTGLSQMLAASKNRFYAAQGRANPGEQAAAPNTQAGPLSVVDQVGQGKMAATRMEMLLSRSPALMEAVARKYPDFDSSKIKSYADAYRSFTSGTDAKQVNAGAVAIQHLADLKRINDENPTESRIPGTAAYKAFHNLLDTVADELGTFYGEPKTNEVIESKKATLGGVLNRNAAIQEQAKAMGIKMDEMEQKWQNAAPSKSYQAPMPGMSDKAKQARAALDPEFAQRMGGAMPQSGGTQHTPGKQAGLPDGTTGKGSDGKPYIVKGGVWVPQS